MNLVDTYLDKSDIEGLGLFAKQFIPKGTIIWRFHFPDFILSKKDYVELDLTEVEKKFIETYSTFKNGYITFYSDNSKYSNHSNRPNTYMNLIGEQVSSADIKEGEEITCNYYEIDDELDEKIFLK